MTYLYRCPRCGFVTERIVPMSERNHQVCERCGMFRLGDQLAGFKLDRDLLAERKVIAIPKNLHTSFSDVHGIHGSPQREQFERDVKQGKIVYDGPGSRWI